MFTAMFVDFFSEVRTEIEKEKEIFERFLLCLYKMKLIDSSWTDVILIIDGEVNYCHIR